MRKVLIFCFVVYLGCDFFNPPECVDSMEVIYDPFEESRDTLSLVVGKEMRLNVRNPPVFKRYSGKSFTIRTSSPDIQIALISMVGERNDTLAIRAVGEGGVSTSIGVSVGEGVGCFISASIPFYVKVSS